MEKINPFRLLGTRARQNGKALTAKEAFLTYDADGSGKMSLKEFKEALVLVGMRLSNEEAKSFFEQADIDGDGQISYQEFEAAIIRDVNRDPAQVDSKTLESTMQEVFGNLDTDNSGTISTQEFKEALSKLKINVPEEKLLTYDVDGDGQISYKEFMKMFLTDVRLAEVKAAFEAYDLDGNGFITAEEFKQSLANRGVLVDDESVRAFMSSDIDGDGKVTYSEFLTREVIDQLRYTTGDSKAEEAPEPQPEPEPEPEPAEAE